MILSKEQIHEHLSRVRRIMDIKPNASILEIRELLQASKSPLSLDKDYIKRLVRGERQKNYNRKSRDKI